VQRVAAVDDKYGVSALFSRPARRSRAASGNGLAVLGWSGSADRGGTDSTRRRRTAKGRRTVWDVETGSATWGRSERNLRSFSVGGRNGQSWTSY